MKLSCLDDRQKAAGRYAEFTLNGEPFTDPGLLEACEEEGYILVAETEVAAQASAAVVRWVPEFGSPYGYRTRRLNGAVTIRPKAGKDRLFAACLSFGSAGIGEVVRLRARVEELEAEVGRLKGEA